MSKKASSGVPTDFTWTDGSNWGMGGFDHEQTMNTGVEESARLPQAKGLSVLPGDVLSQPKHEDLFETFDSDEGLDLVSFLGIKADKTASLVDLSWLDPTQEQDKNRLPRERKPHNEADKRKSDEMGNAIDIIPQLEDAWGGDSTTGKGFVENTGVLKTALPQKLSSADITNLVLRASRQSHFGVPLAKIASELKEALGSDLNRIVKAWAVIRDDHGLAGNVFIRTSSFPGLEKGKWVDVIQQKAGKAKYALGASKDIGKLLKKEVVASIPWDKALSEYKADLHIAGKKVGTGSSKEVLRAAFLSTPVQKVVEATAKPTEHTNHFEAPKFASVITKQELDQKNFVASVHNRLDKLAKKGLISTKRATELKAMDAVKAAKLAAEEMARPKVGTFEFSNINAGSTLADSEKQLERFAAENAVAWLRKRLSEGWAGNKLSALISEQVEPVLQTKLASVFANIRKDHEGLSGFNYVDAGAYATADSLKGCDEGAFLHRGSAIPAVKQIPKCGSCFFSKEGNCTKYGKELISAVPNKELVRTANLSISKPRKVASVESDFGLDNTVLKGFSFEDHKKEKPLDVTMGGGLVVED